jgi:hypothetical protein
MNQIKATIILDSIHAGQRITTLELDYPRFIHSEFMTHRQLSRNAASSRAIPAKAVRHQVWNHPAMPFAWGKNQSGMQASANLSPRRAWVASKIWRGLAKTACVFHWGLEKVGVHKQLTNRVLEPWQMMKVVVTATEWSNFLWLRNHKESQPEIHELARKLFGVLNVSDPTNLKVGEWHLPYVPSYLVASANDGGVTALADAKAISQSCCAQVSFRNLDPSLGKARKISDMLTSGSRVHASPFEHQATPLTRNCSRKHPVEGITHFDTEGVAWSGNFKGWVQNRQLIKGHTK